MLSILKAGYICSVFYDRFFVLCILWLDLPVEYSMVGAMY